MAAITEKSNCPQDSCRHTNAVVVGLPAIERAKIRANTVKQIPLTQGKFALIDDADYEWLNKWKWYAHKRGHTYYAERKVRDQTILMHRIIISVPSRTEIDHISRNGLDNRRSNLRFCTCSENQWHQRLRIDNKTGFKGVSIARFPSQRLYRVRIQVNNKRVHIGFYRSAEIAAQAYDDAATRHFGNFALTNKMLGLL